MMDFISPPVGDQHDQQEKLYEVERRRILYDPRLPFYEDVLKKERGLEENR